MFLQSFCIRCYTKFEIIMGQTDVIYARGNRQYPIQDQLALYLLKEESTSFYHKLLRTFARFRVRLENIPGRGGVDDFTIR